MGIRRQVKWTVFTHSEVSLINYFHLEVFFWDCVLVAILLFGQILHFVGHAEKTQSLLEGVPAILAMQDILKENKNELNRLKNCLFIAHTEN